VVLYITFHLNSVFEHTLITRLISLLLVITEEVRIRAK